MSTTAESFPADTLSGAGTPRLLAQLRLENEALVAKLARLAPALRGLARDLAIARRDSRRKQAQIEALRDENARLRAHLPGGLPTADRGRRRAGRRLS